MNPKKDFLIRYGIHNFVSYNERDAVPSFLINKKAHHNMVQHAEQLIRGMYGDAERINFS